jgi:hypothetical protein
VGAVHVSLQAAQGEHVTVLLATGFMISLFYCTQRLGVTRFFYVQHLISPPMCSKCEPKAQQLQHPGRVLITDSVFLASAPLAPFIHLLVHHAGACHHMFQHCQGLCLLFT